MKCTRDNCTRKGNWGGLCEQHHRLAKLAGERGRIDPTKSRLHIEALCSLGWTPGEIDRASGLSSGECWYVRRERKSILPPTEAAILSVPLGPPYLSRACRPDPTGFLRRLDALQWMGWPLSEIGKRVGRTGHSLSQSIYLKRVPEWLHLAVAEVYDELSCITGPSRSTAGRARSRGAVPPMAWDEDTIDDPDATPVGVLTKRRHAKLPPPDELQWLLDSGESTEAIAARFNAAESSVVTALRRVRRAA